MLDDINLSIDYNYFSDNIFTKHTLEDIKESDLSYIYELFEMEGYFVYDDEIFEIISTERIIHPIIALDSVIQELDDITNELQEIVQNMRNNFQNIKKEANKITKIFKKTI